MEAENQESIEDQDWRADITEPKDILKIGDGEVVFLTFLNEGERRDHIDFGTSVVFKVEVEGEEKVWYINAKNYKFLGQIKSLGKLTGVKAKVSRKGTKRSDTRYTIEKSE